MCSDMGAYDVVTIKKKDRLVWSHVDRKRNNYYVGFFFRLYVFESTSLNRLLI